MGPSSPAKADLYRLLVQSLTPSIHPTTSMDLPIPVDTLTQEEPRIHCIFTSSTQTWCYIVADPSSNHAVIIDPVLSREESSTINTACPDAVLDIIRIHDYTISQILETNAYDQYPSAAWYLRTQILESHGKAPRIAVRQSLKIVQRLYAKKYNVRHKFWAGEFDGKFVDGEVLTAGALQIRVVHLPGRSTDHMGYIIGNHIFTGDCCFHTPFDHGNEMSATAKDNLEISMTRLRNMPKESRISTTRGCPAKLKGPGCVMEIWEQHAAEYDDRPITSKEAEGLDEGMIS